MHFSIFSADYSKCALNSSTNPFNESNIETFGIFLIAFIINTLLSTHGTKFFFTM